MKKWIMNKTFLGVTLILALILLISLDPTISQFTVKLDGKENSILIEIQREHQDLIAPSQPSLIRGELEKN
ncbi:hypothetical protein [Gloeothece verrucosa]|nr:hypothetical protein [Gloeothece verrucosa]